MIRAATLADVSAIRALMKSVAGFWDETWREDVLERALSCVETLAFVHVGADRLDGFACAHDLGFRAYISELVVSPSVQGKGVGGQLLSQLEQSLTGRGCSVVIADVWRDAEGFYRSHGWSPPPVANGLARRPSFLQGKADQLGTLHFLLIRRAGR